MIQCQRFSESVDSGQNQNVAYDEEKKNLDSDWRAPICMKLVTSDSTIDTSSDLPKDLCRNVITAKSMKCYECYESKTRATNVPITDLTC